MNAASAPNTHYLPFIPLPAPPSLALPTPPSLHALILISSPHPSTLPLPPPLPALRPRRLHVASRSDQHIQCRGLTVLGRNVDRRGPALQQHMSPTPHTATPAPTPAAAPAWEGRQARGAATGEIAGEARRGPCVCRQGDMTKAHLTCAARYTSLERPLHLPSPPS